MKLYTAPTIAPVDPSDDLSIFLAGSIEQDKAVLWQNRVIDCLKDLDVIIFNPRREKWEGEVKQDISNPTFNEQVCWELDYLTSAHLVFFYFQGDTLSPISLLELGIVSQNLTNMWQDCLVVCEPNFWRRGNIQVVCDRWGITLLEDLEVGITEVLRRYTARRLYKQR